MMATCARQARTVMFLSDPTLWPYWPLLPMVRRNSGYEELGVVFDAREEGLLGYSSTVFLTNVFCLPPSFEQFFALPHETYDSADELADSGWSVD